jgi:solute carrier family 13 (sodium-dependent dicarboxylate transporter), member 2/3/5
MRREERRVAAVFALIAAAWVFTPLVESLLARQLISDTGIAITGAILLFAMPADWKSRTFLLNWSWARRAPTEVLLLFGGGLSLAQAIDTTGLAAWIGSGLGSLSGLPVLVLAGGVTLLVIFLTELTSNTATTAAFLPVVGALAFGAGDDPLLLAVPAALAASCAFMLPVATPPNAIVYATGHVTVVQMIRAGVILNILGIIVIAGLTGLLLPLLYGR